MAVELTSRFRALGFRERVRGEAGMVEALSVLFFFSGFPALLYQLIWQRALFRIFGVNVESVTIVVTAFMIGLGLGSLAGGWLSRHTRLPLLPLLALIELMTAAFGLVSLSIFETMDTFALGLPLVTTATLALALVLVPTLLMGATLPVLVGHLSRQFENTGRSMGLLYYVNTLGAGSACLVGSLLLFPWLGMAGSITVAAAINVAVALGALATHRYSLAAGSCTSVAAPTPGDAALPSVAANTHTAIPAPHLAFGHVLALAAMAGFVSLSFEIFFFRLQSFATGGSATAFATTLGVFLIGIANGSKQAGQLAADAGPEATAREIVRSLLIACGCAFLYLPLINITAVSAPAATLVSLALVYIIAAAWGMVLPYLAHLGIKADQGSGQNVSYLYLANIAGSATGSILTGFVAMQYVPLTGIAQGLTASSLAGTVLLARAVGVKGIGTRGLCIFAGVAAVAVSLLPRLTEGMLERLQFRGSDPAAFTRVIENRSGIVTVDAQGAVWGHGMYDGKFNTSLVDDVNGVFRPYALSLFHPAPRHVLMIGLATGSWARIVASNPEVEQLTVVEINPGYLQLIAERPEVASVLTDPKVTIVVDDGRRWLRMHPEAKFDAVISNTTWFYRANVTNLLSAEFIDLVSYHLAPGGLFYYNTTHSPRAQRTACLKAPDALRFSNHMVVSNRPIDVDFNRWKGVLQRYAIDGKQILDPKKTADSEVLATLMGLGGTAAPGTGSAGKNMETCSEILARTGGMAPFTDDNMGSEWRHMLGMD